MFYNWEKSVSAMIQRDRVVLERKERANDQNNRWLLSIRQSR